MNTFNTEKEIEIALTAYITKEIEKDRKPSQDECIAYALGFNEAVNLLCESAKWNQQRIWRFNKRERGEGIF